MRYYSKNCLFKEEFSVKKQLIVPIMLASLFSANPILAQDDSNDLELLGGDLRIGYEGEVNLNGTSSNRENEAVDLKGSYVTLSATWKNKIRAVITGKLEKIFEENDIELKDGFKLEEFIADAYIEIREINGSPMAVIVGKHPIAFGQNIQAMPLFKNNPLANLQEIDEVFGLTVDLTEGLFGIFDQAEVSVFETEAGDLSIGKIDGVSVRLSKMLTDNWLLTLSHAEMGNNHLNTGKERRTSVGLIGESTDGMLVGWVEGMFFSNNPEYPNSSFGITTGAMVRVHETTDVIVEYTYIEKELHQIALGTRVALTQNLTIGAEIRYNNYVERKDEIVLGVNLNYSFGSSGRAANEHYIFGKKDN